MPLSPYVTGVSSRFWFEAQPHGFAVRLLHFLEDFMQNINRRQAIAALSVGGLAVGFNQTLAQTSPEPEVVVGELKKLAKDWDSVAFEYDGEAALVVRVPSANKPKRALEVKIEGKTAFLVSYTQVCTHAGCKPAIKPAHTLECGCHGSVFKASDGGVQKGPARQPLQALKLEARGANIAAVGRTEP
jgi:Rieske Fe-S protein